jgi:hypothetical protein
MDTPQPLVIATAYALIATMVNKTRLNIIIR